MRNILFTAIAVLVLVAVLFGWSKTPALGLSEPYTGVTNAQGEFTYTFTNDYVVMPNVQVNPIAGTDKWATVTTITKNNVKVKVTQRTAVTLLGLEVLLAATTPVPNARVDILVTANNN